jgi:hypothetical protein
MSREYLRLLGNLRRLYEPVAQNYKAQQNLIRALGRNPYGIGPPPRVEPEIEFEWPRRFREWRETNRPKLERFAGGSNSNYSVTLNLASQFLRLSRDGRGPVHKGRLYGETLKAHERHWGVRLSKKQAEDFKKHLARIRKKLGLDTLPKLPPGRPRK